MTADPSARGQEPKRPYTGMRDMPDQARSAALEAEARTVARGQESWQGISDHEFRANRVGDQCGFLYWQAAGKHIECGQRQADHHSERGQESGGGTDAVLDEVLAERKRQVLTWGGAGHDDDHENNTWVALIAKHLGKAVTFTRLDPTFRRKMIVVAALAVAAIERYDRMEARDGHY